MKYLIKSVDTYRVESEGEAKQLIEAAKKDSNFELTKYASEYKCTKKKGEVEDEWYRVTLTKEFTSEKEPDRFTEISYDVDMGAFPDPIEKDDEEEF